MTNNLEEFIELMLDNYGSTESFFREQQKQFLIAFLDEANKVSEENQDLFYKKVFNALLSEKELNKFVNENEHSKIAEVFKTLIDIQRSESFILTLRLSILDLSKRVAVDYEKWLI